MVQFCFSVVFAFDVGVTLIIYKVMRNIIALNFQCWSKPQMEWQRQFMYGAYLFLIIHDVFICGHAGTC